ncbi:hypothetical protein [Cysteiniphilum sp. JM-1]|uniref:hypothetical protein n=1 Tax=Cysteiniphilum sp. JM-1 TaxID=2610891 RepID=UPI001243E922|nr:hypothetical protein [Cysteiniphilum sp. JM-1]
MSNKLSLAYRVSALSAMVATLAACSSSPGTPQGSPQSVGVQAEISSAQLSAATVTQTDNSTALTAQVTPQALAVGASHSFTLTLRDKSEDKANRFATQTCEVNAANNYRCDFALAANDGSGSKSKAVSVGTHQLEVSGDGVINSKTVNVEVIPGLFGKIVKTYNMGSYILVVENGGSDQTKQYEELTAAEKNYFYKFQDSEWLCLDQGKGIEILDQWMTQGGFYYFDPTDEKMHFVGLDQAQKPMNFAVDIAELSAGNKEKFKADKESNLVVIDTGSNSSVYQRNAQTHTKVDLGDLAGANDIKLTQNAIMITKDNSMRLAFVHNGILSEWKTLEGGDFSLIDMPKIGQNIAIVHQLVKYSGKKLMHEGFKRVFYFDLANNRVIEVNYPEELENGYPAYFSLDLSENDTLIAQSYDGTFVHMISPERGIDKTSELLSMGEVIAAQHTVAYNNDNEEAFALFYDVKNNTIKQEDLGSVSISKGMSEAPLAPIAVAPMTIAYIDRRGLNSESNDRDNYLVSLYFDEVLEKVSKFERKLTEKRENSDGEALVAADKYTVAAYMVEIPDEDKVESWAADIISRLLLDQPIQLAGNINVRSYAEIYHPQTNVDEARITSNESLLEKAQLVDENCSLGSVLDHLDTLIKSGGSQQESEYVEKTEEASMSQEIEGALNKLLQSVMEFKLVAPGSALHVPSDVTLNCKDNKFTFSAEVPVAYYSDAQMKVNNMMIDASYQAQADELNDLITQIDQGVDQMSLITLPRLQVVLDLLTGTQLIGTQFTHLSPKNMVCYAYQLGDTNVAMLR